MVGPFQHGTLSKSPGSKSKTRKTIIIMRNQTYYIPETIMESIKEEYRNGVSLTKLQSKYNIPYSVLNNKLRHQDLKEDYLMSHCFELVCRAEKTLIGGKFPNYHLNFKIETEKDKNRYESLLFFFAKADINNKNVNIAEGLLS